MKIDSAAVCGFSFSRGGGSRRGHGRSSRHPADSRAVMGFPIQRNKNGKRVIQWWGGVVMEEGGGGADNATEAVRKQKSAAQIVSRLIIQRRDSLSDDPGKKAQII